MRQRVVLVAIACACAGFLALPSALRAWGCEGHQIVATIAAGQLTPHARAEVNRLLKNHPIDPSLQRFCKTSGLTNMQDGATWADDVKHSNGTAAEHFVDVPRTDTEGDLAAVCPEGKCITEAMKRNLDKLKDSATPDAGKADAVRYLIHYAGDIHQPLHCIDNNDIGANCVMVKGVTPSGKTPEKLHSVWDTAFVRQIMNGRSIAATASAVAKKFKGEIADWKTEDFDPDAWALETHEIGEDVAYEELPGGPDPQPPADPPNKSCPVPAPPALTLNAAYRSDAKTSIHEQLAKGGARLALLLNSVWP